MTFADGRRFSIDTRRALVSKLLLDGHWHTTAEVNAWDVGGSEGTRRLRELRAAGLELEKRRKKGSDMFEYRVALNVDDPAQLNLV